MTFTGNICQSAMYVKKMGALEVKNKRFYESKKDERVIGSITRL